jgi:sec-independent protein translocase protein TatA
MFRNPTADLLVVLLIVLLIFGPKRLPGLGKSIGHGIREFKDGITGKSTADEEERPELTAASATPPAATNDHDAAEVASSERRS